MALILSIETTFDACSTALHKDGNLIFYQSLLLKKSHSEKLILLIQNMFSLTNYKISDLDAAAISIGPGYYTGLRVALASIKGLCFGLKIPIIGVNTLLAIAHKIKNIPHNTDFICPTIDKKGDAMYYTLFDKNFKEQTPQNKITVNASMFCDILKNNSIAFLGNAVYKIEKVLFNNNAVIFKNIYTDADSIGEIAFRQFKKSNFCKISDIEPMYL